MPMWEILRGGGTAQFRQPPGRHRSSDRGRGQEDLARGLDELLLGDLAEAGGMVVNESSPLTVSQPPLSWE